MAKILRNLETGSFQQIKHFENIDRPIWSKGNVILDI